jgi:putative ABC transport system substrate-binding protein
VAPDVIVGASTPVVGELRRLTSTIPLVFTQVGDPIDSGLVTNLAQPGGNITGFSAFEPDMGGKWLGVLKEAAPRRGRRVSQLSETLAASIAKKR